MLHAAMVPVLALIASLSLALPAQAATAPIVFDFEDGLQGWELRVVRFASRRRYSEGSGRFSGEDWTRSERLS